MNDSQLQNAVLEELSWEPSVTAAHIGVTAKAGVVTLSGHVRAYSEKAAAEAAVRRVRGVQAVAEELKVELAFESKRDDDQIAAAALQRLAWDTDVPRDAIKIQVENGWVTLTGEVGWDYQRQAAAQDIERLFGVVGISNQTSIKPRPNTEDIRERITKALSRTWFFEHDNVQVSASGGEIHLTGRVHSPHDRITAGAAAWAAAGTTGVQNDIAVMR